MDNELKDYKQYLRKFPTYDVLEFLSKESMDIYTNCENGIKMENISALIIYFSEFMYWTIRNYYCKLKSSDFTNYFGHWFEYYLKDFFDEYNVNYVKINKIIKKLQTGR